ncbi:MAG TPA: bifunctional DNA-formamidopyrimidine glycosylase/DNA-(apurinic or apyrimidinic site) lyase [Rhodanobacteraceae bacterium]|nr:bifunctional DNA-formamidopyrimidine glycosylase/DNA-(apurinic or apyrimidinic site) lyase [Rhodanobacteraceae bacterium]
MPELPEVETTRRGIAPFVEGRVVTRVILRRHTLRWPIPRAIEAQLPGRRIDTVERRAKYLLLHTDGGAALIHLGMSGSLRITDPDAPWRKHDHYEFVLDPGRALRFNDPRRFGCLLWQKPGEVHPLLRHLGPEPLGDEFDGDVLWTASRGHHAAVKSFLMDQSIVVGVGNIYASEALFMARVHPRRAAGRVSRERYARIAAAIRGVLSYSIARGGTTIRDFIAPDGEQGHFEQELQVYGRAGEPCKICGTPIKSAVIAQRTTYWCPHCQH